MRKIKNPWMQKDGYNCFGCSPDNPIGIHMEFYENGDEIISFFVNPVLIAKVNMRTIK